MKTAYLVYEVNLYEQDFGAIDSDEVPVAVFSTEEFAKNYIYKHNHPQAFNGIKGDRELLYMKLPFD